MKKAFDTLLLSMIFAFSVFSVALAVDAQSVKIVTLDNCILMASKENPLLAKWTTGIKSAESSVDAAKAQFRPSVNITGRYGYGTETDTDTVIIMPQYQSSVNQAATNSNYVKLEVQQFLADGGKTRYAVSANRENVDSETAGYRSELLRVLCQVKEIYYRSRMEAGLIILYNQSIERNQQLRNMTAIRVENGDAVPQEVMRAEANLQNAISQQITVATKYSKSLDQLAQVMGIAQRNFDTSGELPTINQLDDTSVYFDKIYQLAITNRQDLQQIKAQRKNKEFLARAATVSNTPNLILEGDVLHNSQQNAQNSWLIALNVNCPLYDGGKAKSQAEEYTRQAQGLVEDERRLKLEIGTDIKTGLNDFLSYQAILVSNQSALKQAEENLRVIQIGYKYGARSLLEYTDALNLIDNATAAILQTRFSLLQAYINLDRAAGCQLDLDNL